MDDSKTVRSDTLEEINVIDPLYGKQQKDVANMRASLLACNENDPQSTRIALHNITVMRVYHQLSRIIRYTDMMDKLEDKLYESIDKSLDEMDTDNPSTWLTLLGIQEKLQKCMIESHKLLEPYLSIEDFAEMQTIEVPQQQSFGAMIMEQESRDKLRESAQAVLAALEQDGGN